MTERMRKTWLRAVTSSREPNKRRSWLPSTIKAERTDALADVAHVEQRVERSAAALQQARLRLADSLRTRPTAGRDADNADKLRKKVEEYQLLKSLQSGARDLEATSDSGLLSSVMGLYGQAVGNILDELVSTDRSIEADVIDKLASFVEAERGVGRLRKKVNEANVDADTLKYRLQTALQQGSEKVDKVQEELDKCQARLEGLRDNYIADIYNLSSRELEVASVFSVLVEIQAEYHRTAAAALDGVLPQLTAKIATYPRRPVFGCPLEDHLRYSGRSIAIVLEICCSALNEIGMREEGLFRIPGNVTKIRKLKAGFDAGEIDLSDFAYDPHSLAGALKLYLRELPDPLMSHTVFAKWMNAARLDGEVRIAAIDAVLAQLPAANHANLRYFVKFLSLLSSNTLQTKMSSSNLAIVIGPNMLWNPVDGDNMVGNRLSECLISNADRFFPGAIEFKSSLIGSLHERTGGFTDSHVAATVDSRATPPLERHANRYEPVVQKRPKTKAPPPPRVAPPRPAPAPPLAADSALTGATADMVYPDGVGSRSPSLHSTDSFTECYSSEDVRAHEHMASPSAEDHSAASSEAAESLDVADSPQPRSHRKTHSAGQPTRPPPPAKELLERNSAARLSLTGAKTSAAPVVREPPVPAPRQRLPASPAATSVPPTVLHIEDDGAAVVSADARLSSPDSARPRPPLPTKPRGVQADAAITHL